MSVCGLGGIREEEDEGDPICLFCPPDVSESRLRDLARGVVAQEGLKLLTHLHPWLMNTHTNTQRRSQKSRSFLLFNIKAVRDRWMDRFS